MFGRGSNPWHQSMETMTLLEGNEVFLLFPSVNWSLAFVCFVSFLV